MNLKAAEKAIKEGFIKVLASLIPADKEPDKVPDISSYRSITVLRPDRLGDFTLTIPAISAVISRMHPDCVLNVVCGTRGRELAKAFFGRHNVIVYEKNLLSFLKICFYLLLTRHDAVINFHSYPFSMTSAIFTLFTKSPVRCGFKETERVKNPLAPKVFNKGIILNDDAVHEKEKNIKLIEALGFKYNSEQERTYFKPDIPEAALQEADAFFKENGIKPEDTVIGIHPSLMKADNRWEKSNYVTLCAMLKSSYPGIKLAALHGMGEEKEMALFRELAGDAVLYYPHNNILSLMAIAGRMKLFVCNDSGIMHTCSLMTKVIAIFGPSTLSRWSPPGPYNNVCLQKLDGKCDSVTPYEVMENISLIINQ